MLQLDCVECEPKGYAVTIARKQIVGVGLAAAFLASIVLYLFFPPHALWPRRENRGGSMFQEPSRLCFPSHFYSH